MRVKMNTSEINHMLMKRIKDEYEFNIIEIFIIEIYLKVIIIVLKL